MKNISDKVNEADNNICPRITDPYLKCYGTKLDSENTQKAVRYCLGDYMNCDVYLRHLAILADEQKHSQPENQ